MFDHESDILIRILLFKVSGCFFSFFILLCKKAYRLLNIYIYIRLIGEVNSTVQCLYQDIQRKTCTYAFYMYKLYTRQVEKKKKTFNIIINIQIRIITSPIIMKNRKILIDNN